MTPEQAQDIADRTLVEIDDRLAWAAEAHKPLYAADRERVQSDLAGLLLCRQWGDSLNHADRYAEGLLRTALLYGVELRGDDHA